MNETVSRGGRQVPGFALGNPEAIRYAVAGAAAGGVLELVARGPEVGQFVVAAAGGALIGLGIWWVVKES